MAVIESQSEETTKTLLEKEQQLQRRLYNVEERPDMHDREDREHSEEYASVCELSEGVAFLCGGERQLR